MRDNEVLYGAGRAVRQDRFPLSLDAFRDIPRHIVVEKHEDAETAVKRLTNFYQKGLDQHAKKRGITIDLPLNELWPEKFADAYSWMQNAYYDIQGSPQLIFGELVKNAEMHGKGFRGATAAWIRPGVFSLRVADRGEGIGSSQEHGDGIGHIFISGFATEPIRTKQQKNGHIMAITRDLNSFRLPEKVGLFELDIAPEVAFIQNRLAQNKKLPQYHPDSMTSWHYDKSVGPFGGSVIKNRLGKTIEIRPFTKEPDPTI